ncbi:uncharacterized protein LOC131837270 [Mustela lutreola]|uniref:uncharacterized protein LOC131837270 n=1 Tax=Mustela lutreola TaxID=9666 RepID=UPI00279794ED|nr:uncharacterized protein LOC131837270 [Mustela lutreola]
MHPQELVQPADCPDPHFAVQLGRRLRPPAPASPRSPRSPRPRRPRKTRGRRPRPSATLRARARSRARPSRERGCHAFPAARAVCGRGEPHPARPGLGLARALCPTAAADWPAGAARSGPPPRVTERRPAPRDDGRPAGSPGPPPPPPPPRRPGPREDCRVGAEPSHPGGGEGTPLEQAPKGKGVRTALDKGHVCGVPAFAILFDGNRAQKGKRPAAPAGSHTRRTPTGQLSLSGPAVAPGQASGRTGSGPRQLRLGGLVLPPRGPFSGNSCPLERTVSFRNFPAGHQLPFPFIARTPAPPMFCLSHPWCRPPVDSLLPQQLGTDPWALGVGGGAGGAPWD